MKKKQTFKRNELTKNMKFKIICDNSYHIYMLNYSPLLKLFIQKKQKRMISNNCFRIRRYISAMFHQQMCYKKTHKILMSDVERTCFEWFVTKSWHSRLWYLQIKENNNWYLKISFKPYNNNNNSYLKISFDSNN